METFITGAGALGLVKAVVDFIKYLRAGNTNGWVTQLAVWVAGIGVTLLIKVSDFAGNFDIGGVVLNDANTGTVILAGLGLGSAAMLVNEVKQAIDRNDSAQKPDLLPAASGNNNDVR